MDDVYICVLNPAGVLVGVTIMDSKNAQETIKQLRAGKRKIKTFSDYQSYCEFIDEYTQDMMERGGWYK